MHTNGTLGSLKKATVIAFFCLFGVSGALFGADNSCGGSSCEESETCAATGVFLCSDWNDGSYDGWATSSNLDSKGGKHGDIRSAVGINGTKGWAHEIYPAKAETVFYGNSVINGYKGPLYTRLYIRFSDNYVHGMVCGLQKQFYHKWLNSDGSETRIMLGSARASEISRNTSDKRFSGEPDSVGIMTFDWLGHHIEWPDQPGIVLMQPGQWYSVEFMSEYRSNDGTMTVKVWVNGQLQIQRTVAAATASWKSGAWSGVQETSWMGGEDSCNKITEQQQVFKDNVVISRNYIGPIGGFLAPPRPPSQVTTQ